MKMATLYNKKYIKKKNVYLKVSNFNVTNIHSYTRQWTKRVKQLKKNVFIVFANNVSVFKHVYTSLYNFPRQLFTSKFIKRQSLYFP